MAGKRTAVIACDLAVDAAGRMLALGVPPAPLGELVGAAWPLAKRLRHLERRERQARAGHRVAACEHAAAVAAVNRKLDALALDLVPSAPQCLPGQREAALWRGAGR